MTRWIMIAAIGLLAAIIALAFVYPRTMISPGPLVTAHADLASNCFACHSPFLGPSAQRCMTCHPPADIGRRTTKGIPISSAGARPPFHEMLASQNCVACHSDHLEPFFTASMTRFDHSLLTSTARNKCTTCHSGPEDELHRYQATMCTQCHTLDHWKPATFDHNKFFVLDRHHSTSCAACHNKRNYSEYTCFGCHEHQADRMRARHLKKGVREISNCVLCHRNAHEAGDDDQKRRSEDD